MSEINKQKEKLESDICRLVKEFEILEQGIVVCDIIFKAEDVFVCGQSSPICRMHEIKVIINKN